MLVVLVLVIFSAFAGTWAAKEEKLLSPSALEMFVDELPDMPRISGFDVVKGVSVPKSLKIGMFSKKWVCLSLHLLSLLYFYLFSV